MLVVTLLIDSRMAIKNLKVLLEGCLGEIGRGDCIAEVGMIQMSDDLLPCPFRLIADRPQIALNCFDNGPPPTG